MIFKSKRIFRSHSRPQQNLWSLDLVLACLVMLTITFFGLTLYSILQANVALLPDELSPFFSFKILDTSSAASLFVTLLGALLVRHQFSAGLLPRINYRSFATTINDSNNPVAPFETWRVNIYNSGLGAAIINSTGYILELPDVKSAIFTGNHQEIIIELTKMSLVRNRDYWLANLTAGFALSPKDDYTVFEIKKEHLAKLKRLDMVLYFQSQLGGKYGREIFLVPHRMAEPKQQVT